MPSPRQTVRDYILDALKTITKANGYALDVETVELNSRLIRDLNLSDCPAIKLVTKDDTDLSETLGFNVGNQYFQSWDMELLLHMPDPGDAAIEDAGELFLGAVAKCLIKNRHANDDKPSNIKIKSIKTDDFERIENKIAQLSVTINVRYEFTLGDL